ncbi:MAG: hypothetical protein SGI73_20755, partial [Chloroflexota bacterium]|nr:hypothetical protein [Chloroflexota bacterium]
MITFAIPTDAPRVAGPAQGEWTYADWEQLPDDGNSYEIINGVLYVTTAPKTIHAWLNDVSPCSWVYPCAWENSDIVFP